MAERPFMSLGTVAVFERAERAARQRDEKTFRDCLRELGCRKRGEELIAELEELREEVEGPDVPSPLTHGVNPKDVEGLTVVTDNDCHVRWDMLRQATRSIWLSTYPLRDGRGDLRKILADRVRQRVAVNVIVSKRPVTPGGHAEEVIDDLRRDGARVIVTTNHSKCVVVDEADVMVGSANLQDIIYRDLALRFRSRSVAKVIIEYLDGLVRYAR